MTKEKPIHDPCLPDGLEQSYLMKPAEFLPKRTAQLYFGVRESTSATPVSSKSSELITPLPAVPVQSASSSIYSVASSSPLSRRVRSSKRKSKALGNVPEEVEVRTQIT